MAPRRPALLQRRGGAGRAREPRPAPLPPGAAGLGGVFPSQRGSAEQGPSSRLPLVGRALRRSGEKGKRSHQVSSCPLAAILRDPSGKRIRRFLVSLPREPASRHRPISVAERRRAGSGVLSQPMATGARAAAGGAAVAAILWQAAAVRGAGVGCVAAEARPGPVPSRPAPPREGGLSTFFTKVWPWPGVGCLERRFPPWACRGGSAGRLVPELGWWPCERGLRYPAEVAVMY